MTETEPIHRIVKELERAWNAGDGAGFAAPFAEDADFINVLGEHYKRRETIAKGHQYIFDTIYKGSENSYTLEAVRFVRPDVAIAFIHAKLKVREGDGVKELQARPTLVLARDDGEWQVVALQNTTVAPPRFDGVDSEDFTPSPHEGSPTGTSSGRLRS